MAREIQLTDWSTAGNRSNRSSGVQIPRDICTRFGRYLYSTKCSWIIIIIIDQLACVASVPERCERNSGRAKNGTRAKKCSRLIFRAARMRKNSFARPQFRSRGTGTLATQAIDQSKGKLLKQSENFVGDYYQLPHLK